MDYSETKNTIKSKLVQLASDGQFGKGQAVSVEFQETIKGPQFMSSVFFASVRLSGGDETHVVAKIQLNDDVMRKKFAYDGFFHNERHAYLDLLPLIHQESIEVFPKCFYGCATKGKNWKEDMIILEDIHKKGFILTSEVLILDLDHLSLAIHKLGQFHGLSYAWKQTNGCSPIKNELLPLRNPDHKAELVMGMFYHTLKKNIESFKQEGLNYGVLQKVIHVAETVENCIDFFTAPEEPFAVICHGDFNRNNFMFKYQNGRPVEVKFFDLQWSSYSDPVVDLSFILYMNTDPETRNSHWDRLFQIYWTGVTSICSDPGFTFDEFLKNFAKRVPLILGDIAFFLPIMICAKSNHATIVGPKDTVKLPIKEKLAIFKTMGGSEAHKLVDSVVRDMYERRYFDEFVEAIKTK